MKTRNEKIYQERKKEIMEKCFECYAEYGLNSVGIKTLAKACGCTSGNLYTYFDNLDDLIKASAQHCMSKVEADFLALAPKSCDDVIRFIEEVPRWIAKNHGKEYRLMYQIYTHPKYIEDGKKFVREVNMRYNEYAKNLAKTLALSTKIVIALVFILIRTAVHYSLFEDEVYLNLQTEILKGFVKRYIN